MLQFGLLSDEDSDGNEAACSDEEEGFELAALEGLNSGTVYSSLGHSSLLALSLETHSIYCGIKPNEPFLRRTERAIQSKGNEKESK